MNLRKIKNKNELSMLFDLSRDSQVLTLKNFFGNDYEDVIERYKNINSDNKVEKVQFIIDNKVNGIDYTRVFHFTRMKEIYFELKKRRDLIEYENDFSNSVIESGCLEEVKNYNVDDCYWNGCLVLNQEVYRNNKYFLNMPDVLWKFNPYYLELYRKERIPLIFQVDVPISSITFSIEKSTLRFFEEVSPDVIYIYCLLNNIPFCGADNYTLSESDAVYDLSILEGKEGL